MLMLFGATLSLTGLGLPRLLSSAKVADRGAHIPGALDRRLVGWMRR